MTYTWFPLMISLKSWSLSLLLCILFPFCSPDWIFSIDISFISLILCSASSLMLNLPFEPFSHWLYSSVPKFLFGAFFFPLSFCWTAQFIIILLSWYRYFVYLCSIIALWESLKQFFWIIYWAIPASAFPWGLSLKVYYIPLPELCFPNSLWFL